MLADHPQGVFPVDEYPPTQPVHFNLAETHDPLSGGPLYAEERLYAPAIHQKWGFFSCHEWQYDGSLALAQAAQPTTPAGIATEIGTSAESSFDTCLAVRRSLRAL